MSPLGAFLQLLRQAPGRQVAAVLVLMILGGLTEGFGLLLLAPLLESLSQAGSSQGPLQGGLETLARLGFPLEAFPLLGLFIILVGLRSAIQFGREQVGARLQHHLVDQLRHQCFSALLQVEWRWLVSTRRADHANLLLTDVSRVGQGLQFGLSLLALTVTTLAYLLAALSLSWRLTGLALVSGGLVFALLSRQRRGALKLGKAMTQASRSLHGNIQDSLEGIKLTRILGTERRHLQDFAETMAATRRQQLAFTRGTSLSRALFQTAGALLLALYIYLGLVIWHLPIAELLILVLIFAKLIPLLMQGQQQLHHWLHALPAFEETQLLLAECHSHAEPHPQEHLLPLVLKEGIRLEQVRVTYAERESPALNGIDVSFPARTTTAIMGASGAGKSTLADVLMGLLSPDEGKLWVDDQPVTGAERLAWRRQVAYVPQEVFLFNASVRANLLWGRPDASEQALIQSLHRAAADFVLQLPQGLDTPVGDGGIRLSGGERQRIALARALLERPSLLILDEATSALDVANEARIRQAIEHLHGDLTVVIIGHRLPTLEHADQVILMDRGRIAAQGTWAQVKHYLPTGS